MILQEEEELIWEAYKSQILPVKPWGHVKMGSYDWDSYYSVVNCMSTREMLTLSIFRNLHTKSLYIFLV